MKTKLLTKSNFLEFIQCPERLNKSLISKVELDECTLRVLENGNQVGLLARELFPTGVEVSFSSVGTEELKEILKVPGVTLFEVPFSTSRLLARIDVLSVLSDGTLKISEVKSCTSFKEDEHIPDIYFQKRVIEESTGLEVSKLEIIHVNKEYVFNGSWEVQKYFKFVEVPTDKSIQKLINHKIEECLGYLTSRFPSFKPGMHCKKPYDCPHFRKCTQNLGTVLNLRRGGKKIWEFVDEGIKDISDIVDVTRLTPYQLKQYKHETIGRNILNIPKIKEFLGSIVFPCTFLDFEAFSTPIIHNLGITKLSPYDQIVFQANLKICESFMNASGEQYNFIAYKGSDPRRQISKFLFENLPNTGSVIVYHKQYEKKRLEELAVFFPEYSEKFSSVIDRLMDLEDIFSKGWFVGNSHGSTSVKQILGIVCPEMANEYDNLQLINNGQLASIRFEIIFRNLLSTFEEQQILEALEEYCSLDVYSLYKILFQLKRLCVLNRK